MHVACFVVAFYRLFCTAWVSNMSSVCSSRCYLCMICDCVTNMADTVCLCLCVCVWQCHTGILGGGHYVTYAKNPNNKWYCYNDSSCKVWPWPLYMHTTLCVWCMPHAVHSWLTDELLDMVHKHRISDELLTSALSFSWFYTFAFCIYCIPAFWTVPHFRVLHFQSLRLWNVHLYFLVSIHLR